MPTREENDLTRTRLAGERTQLAWVRTGLAAIAVGVGLARIVPLLDPSVVAWPYETLGVAYCIFGLSLIGFGIQRGRLSADERIHRPVVPGSTQVLAIGGSALAVATIIVVLFAR